MTGHAFTVRVPRSVARKLRIYAFDNDRPVKEILREAVRTHCLAIGIPWVDEEEGTGGGTPEAPR